MIWRSKKDRGKDATEPSPPAEETTAGAPQVEADAVLDFVGDVLRAMGEHAFDLPDVDADTVCERFDAWSRHLLVGAPRPGDDPDAEAPRERDWHGASRFVWRHRRAERDSVTRGFSDLREALWTFVHAIGRTASDDRDTDAALTRQMERLREVVNADRPEAIKQEAVAAVSFLGNVVAERKQRERERMDALRDSLADARGELEAAKEQMERDSLTGLFNRGAFDDQLGRTADLGRVFGLPSWLFMFDIDHFKQVNDTHGHPMGDAVLRKVAGRLVATFLRRDDFVARFGGEEFAALVRSDSPNDAEILAERLLQAVRDLEVEHEGQTVRVTISVGMARLLPGESEASWLERADAALYRAKDGGRDRVCVASEETPEGA